METNLMDYLDTFRSLLDKETDILSGILKMENEKYEALRAVDIQKLMEINAKEEESLQFLESIESRRKEIVVLLSKNMDFAPTATLSEMLARFKDSKYHNIKNELLVMKDKIKRESGKLKVTMMENSDIIKTNLEIINLTLSMSNKQLIDNTYNQSPKKEDRDKLYIVNQIA